MLQCINLQYIFVYLLHLPFLLFLSLLTFFPSSSLLLTPFPSHFLLPHFPSHSFSSLSSFLLLLGLHADGLRQGHRGAQCHQHEERQAIQLLRAAVGLEGLRCEAVGPVIPRGAQGFPSPVGLRFTASDLCVVEKYRHFGWKNHGNKPHFTWVCAWFICNKLVVHEKHWVETSGLPADNKLISGWLVHGCIPSRECQKSPAACQTVK